MIPTESDIILTGTSDNSSREPDLAQDDSENGYATIQTTDFNFSSSLDLLHDANSGSQELSPSIPNTPNIIIACNRPRLKECSIRISPMSILRYQNTEPYFCSSPKQNV